MRIALNNQRQESEVLGLLLLYQTVFKHFPVNYLFIRLAHVESIELARRSQPLRFDGIHP